MAFQRQRIPFQQKSYLLYRHSQEVLVKQQWPINPITILKNHLHVNRAPPHTTLRVIISLTGRNFLQRCISTWQQLATHVQRDSDSFLAAPRTYSSQASYRTSSKPWIDGLQISEILVFGWRICPKLRFEVTMELTSRLAYAYKVTRSDLGVSLLRTIRPSPWRFSVHPSQVTICNSK